MADCDVRACSGTEPPSQRLTVAFEGPLFLAERAPAPGKAPAALDLDEPTGRARLSYRRAAEVFKAVSGGSTLHQLRHSALTHLAEDGVPITLLMAKSRHESLRTLQRYARPGVEAVARLTAEKRPGATTVARGGIDAQRLPRSVRSTARNTPGSGAGGRVRRLARSPSPGPSLIFRP